MEISDELIQRFFNDACTAEEAEMVTSYLQQHPELLEKYAPKKEWSETEMQKQVPASVTEDMWRVINAQTKPKTTVIWLKRLSIAACLAGILLVSYQWMQQSSQQKSIVSTRQRDSVQLVVVQHKIVRNTSDKEMMIALTDGSVVQLQANSELRYDEPFQNNTRDIALSGKAFFKVAKDKTKPFTVTAGGLSTTALGTSFWIDDNKKGNKVSVQLITGKVIITKAPVSTIKNFATVYLIPGEELQFETATEKYSVQKFNQQNSSQNKKTERKRTEYVTPDGNLLFNNTPLKTVFNTLENRYSITITFNEADIRNSTFTGQYKPTESLEDILQTVVLLNHLHMQKGSSGYIITK